MTQYKIGDRVERISDSWSGKIKKGFKGNVVELTEEYNYIFVQWDEYPRSVHTCTTYIKKIDGKGITYKPNCIQLPTKRRKSNV